VQIDFEDDAGSGCEDEGEDGNEGDEGNFKEESGDYEHQGDGDETGDYQEEEGHELEQYENDKNALVAESDELSSFLTNTKICSPSVPGIPPTNTVSFAPQANNSNNNLFTFGSSSSFSFGTSTFGVANNVFGSNANTSTVVEDFIKTPTFSNYMKITPEPEKKIVEYFQTKYPEKGQLVEESILMAFMVSNITGFGVNTQDCFNQLMMSALKASNANTFITAVLSKLGLIHPEEKPAMKPELVTDSVVKALATFLEQNLAPIVVLRCAQEFFNPSTPAAKAGIKIPARESVLEVVNRQLALLK
jgi:hypothetical protein